MRGEESIGQSKINGKEKWNHKISKDFTEDKLKTYLREQIKKANSTENVIDVLL